MRSEDIQALISHRLQRAVESLHAAEIMLHNQMFTFSNLGNGRAINSLEKGLYLTFRNQDLWMKLLSYLRQGEIACQGSYKT